MNLLFTRQTKIFITEIYNISKHPSSLAKVIFYCRFYFLDNIPSDKYNGFRCKSQENIKFIRFSWPTRPYGQIHGLGSNVFFVEFRLDSILNKQKIIKKIAFLVKIAKMVSFRSNQKIFGGFGSGKIKK
jgi:hypothetical protein